MSKVLLIIVNGKLPVGDVLASKIYDWGWIWLNVLNIIICILSFPKAENTHGFGGTMKTDTIAATPRFCLRLRISHLITTIAISSIVIGALTALFSLIILKSCNRKVSSDSWLWSDTGNRTVEAANRTKSII